MTPTNRHAPNTGFALLLTIVVISVVLAVGISLLDITVKQISLSTTGRDSEVAFHGAQASVECAQVVVDTIDFINSGANAVDIDCFEDTLSSVSPNMSDAGRTAEYSFQFNWNNSEQDLCSESDIYIMDARGGAYTKNFSNQGLASETCTDGNICTLVFARGFNRGCADLSSLRTVQRELTISY